MRRRDFVTLLGGATLVMPLAGRARATAKRASVGVIDDSPLWDPFRRQLHELDYVEGQNIVYEYRGADGIAERLDAAATALAQARVDVIAVYGTPAAQAAQRATRNIPIVAIGIGDPIAAGLVSSLGRPGDNITGSTILSADLASKRLQILKDAIPAASRLALLWNPDNASNAAIVREFLKAAPLFQMSLVQLQARTADELAAILAQMSSDRPDALLTTNDPLLQTQIKKVIDFLLQNRIPGLFQLRQNVADGGLMAYGANLADLFRRGGVYVDKILHGTKPSDLPIEQPLTFELVINLKTAKAIGVDFPPALLARADEVIE